MTENVTDIDEVMIQDTDEDESLALLCGCFPIAVPRGFFYQTFRRMLRRKKPRDLSGCPNSNNSNRTSVSMDRRELLQEILGEDEVMNQLNEANLTIGPGQYVTKGGKAWVVESQMSLRGFEDCRFRYEQRLKKRGHPRTKLETVDKGEKLRSRLTMASRRRCWELRKIVDKAKRLTGLRKAMQDAQAEVAQDDSIESMDNAQVEKFGSPERLLCAAGGDRNASLEGTKHRNHGDRTSVEKEETDIKQDSPVGCAYQSSQQPVKPRGTPELIEGGADGGMPLDISQLKVSIGNGDIQKLVKACSALLAEQYEDAAPLVAGDITKAKSDSTHPGSTDISE